MSGLIDTIVRRRRASASSRLGPSPEELERLPWGEVPEPADEADEPRWEPAEPGFHDPAPAPQPPEARQPPEPRESHRQPEPPEAEPLAYPPLRERLALRRRARHLAAIREVQLRDLGGFLLELHRFGRRRDDLVRAKLEATAATDAELRALHHRLDEEAPIGEVRRAGIGGACPACGAVHGSLDRFCASCGESLGR